MLPEVRKILREEIKQKLKEWNLNWKTIQSVDIKELYGCPIGWRTLHKIIKDDNYQTFSSVQINLLKFFNIPYVCNYGIVQLLNIESNA
tara:strand:+ start:342 stop:608 length:267 start_codon:yes stop_codon:yes gene_type:complete